MDLAHFSIATFLFMKKDTHKSQKILPIPSNIPMTPLSYLKVITGKITLKKYTYKFENTLTTPF